VPEGTATRIEERVAMVDGVPIHWCHAAPLPGRAPVLYLHGVPTHSEDWIPFLERTGGIAPDLPGFGRSGKSSDFDYTIDGYARFLAAFLAELEVDSFSLVVHDWGGVGLALAQEMPERIERLVVMDAVPLLPEYSWHRLARLWRLPVLGELVMGFTTRATFRLLSREANARPGPMPDAFVDSVWRGFDHGTQRAILRLYRSASPRELAAAGVHLSAVRCPALVLWGEQDPYVDSSFAARYGEALGGPTRVEVVPDAGHWPWIDRPEVIDTVAEFLGAGREPSAPS
jgi:pimeloyl-ACP methyl ester carboxylesterase